MSDSEIARDRWAEALTDFSRTYEGRLASFEVLGPELGVQPEVRNLPLLGVSADRPEQDPSIAISVARSTTVHLTHVIREVQRVILEHDAENDTAALLIESQDGTRTILQVNAAHGEHR